MKDCSQQFGRSVCKQTMDIDILDGGKMEKQLRNWVNLWTLSALVARWGLQAREGGGLGIFIIGDRLRG
jgi:hypothetical protein